MFRIEQHAGKLDQRITITRQVLVSDNMGGNTVTWSTIGSLWAAVAPMSGRERDMANQTESPRNYRFTVRRTAASLNILAKDRITWGSKVMNVRFIADAGNRAQYLTIEAEDGVAA